MVGPLFSLPLWPISSFFSDPTIVIARYNFVLFAIVLLILYLWLRKWFDQKFLLTFLLLLFLVFAVVDGTGEQESGAVASAVALEAVGRELAESPPGWDVPTRLCRAVLGATGATAYNVLQNNGPAAHQAVFHVHFHIIPKHAKEGLGIGWYPSSLDPQVGKELAEDIREALAEPSTT
jgi:hypothetical protein